MEAHEDSAFGPLYLDTEFVRRIYLDLTGLPPSVETIQAFLGDQRGSRQKREAD